MADESKPKQGFSFSFAKKVEKKTIKGPLIAGNDHEESTETDFISGVEGKEVKSHKPKEEPKKFVIPLIESNRWQLPGKTSRTQENEKEKEESPAPKMEKAKVELPTESLESQAARELIQEAARLNEDEEEDSEARLNLTVPLLMQNRIPEGYETDEKLDVALRADEADVADYDEMPIEEYGLAMLRGMGWKEGEGIGKNKQLVAPVDAVVRPKGMGLGADRSQMLQMQGGKEKKLKPGDTKDGEEKLDYVKGAGGVILKGPHKDLYGKIEGVDEDNSRVMMKLTISQQLISINKFHIQLVTKKDYEKNAKILNKVKVDKYREEEQKKKKSRRSTSPDTSRDKDRYKNRDREDKHKHSDRKRKHEEDDRSDKKSSKSSSNGQPHRDYWLRPQLRVRVVDKHYRKGKYYNMKVEVVDVVSMDTCICKTDEGKVLEELSQTMLETVIPKSDTAHVMIVSGKYRGQIGEIIKKDKSKSTATIQLLSNRDKAVKLDYDSICEYLGDIHAELDY